MSYPAVHRQCTLGLALTLASIATSPATTGQENGPASPWHWSVGVEAQGGDYTISGPNRTTVLHPLGPGLTLGVSHDNGWSLLTSASHREDTDPLTGAAEGQLEFQTDSLGLELLWSGESLWASLAWRRDDDDTRLRATLDGGARPGGVSPGVGDVAGAESLTLSYDERQRTDTATVSVGTTRDLGSFTAGGTLWLSVLAAEIDRSVDLPLVAQNLIVLRDDQETLDGVDAGVDLWLDHYHELSQELTLVPGLGLAWQSSLDGEISGSALTSLSRRSRTRALPPTSQTSEQDAGDQASADLHVALLAGPWSWTASVVKPWLEAPRDLQWQVGVRYDH